MEDSVISWHLLYITYANLYKHFKITFKYFQVSCLSYYDDSPRLCVGLLFGRPTRRLTGTSNCPGVSCEPLCPGVELASFQEASYERDLLIYFHDGFEAGSWPAHNMDFPA